MRQRSEIPRETAWKMKQMYEERDSIGRRVWSQARIASYFGVSETTVFRAVNSLGKFGTEPLPAVRSDQQMDSEAGDSLQRVLSATERMARDAALQKELQPDRLLSELTGDSDDRRDDQA